MNCICCERNKISPNIPPFGGFICIREHLQCSECNDRTAGACGICCGSTSFVQMFYNRQIDSIRLQNSVLPLPTAPSQTLLEDHFMDKEDCSYNFSKSLMNDIDVHSSISQTQLSMAESNDTYSDIVDSPKKHMEPNELTTTNNSTALEGEMPNEVRFSQDENKINSDPILRMPTSLQHLTPKECEQMKTLFFGSNTHNSSSNFTFQFRLENGVMVFDPPVVDHCSSNNEPAVMSVPEKTQKNEEVVVEKMDKTTISSKQHNIINTSELRFMDSNDSLNNYCSGSTVQSKLKPICNDQPSIKTTLSSKALHEFEISNTAPKTERVQNYLKTYNPPTTVIETASKSIMTNETAANTPNVTAKYRTVCVSTESEPSLKPISTNNRESPHSNASGKYVSQNFFVLQSTLTPNLMSSLNNYTKNKIQDPNMDMRMRKLIETLKEDSQQEPICEKPILETSKNFIKFPTTNDIHSSSHLNISNIENGAVPCSVANDTVCTCDPSDKSLMDSCYLLSTVMRAHYQPPHEKICPLHQQRFLPHPIEPLPQFKLVNCPQSMLNELYEIKTTDHTLRPMHASHLKIPRIPIRCPESTCERMIFVSDFSKHMVVDHLKLPMERLSPGQCKNFFLDPHLGRIGTSKCHLIYLIRHKITDLGSSKYKDFLPMLVMSGRIKLSQICGEDDFGEDDIQFLMIWLTGIVPEEFPVSVSLTVWSRSGVTPRCHLVYSGCLYSIRKSQAIIDVYKSGQGMLLSPNQMDMLTDYGKDMLELQVTVH